MRNKLIAAAKADVDVTAYMWGGNGEDAAGIDNLRSYVGRYEVADSAHTKTENIERVMARVAALRAKGILHIPLQDCSGAVIKWHNLAGVEISDRTAARLYSGSVKVTRETIQPGDMCFHHNGSKISHVGLYIGNGKVIESIGRDRGTVITDFARRSNGALYWTHFGYWPALKISVPPDILAEADDDGRQQVTSIMGSVRVRSIPKTGATIYLLRKGQSLPIDETDADTGWYCVTTPNGTGFITNNKRYVEVK